ncbi:hypothetical protein L7F22_048886 [Adiantum nelumboides]|nr:hypothetical protein [Adiantum nelumboides]
MLTLGRPTNIPADAVFTPIVVNPFINQHYYYVHLLDISVDSAPFLLDQGIFDLDVNTGMGGAYIDAGSTITYLPTEVYVALRDTVEDIIADNSPQLRSDNPVQNFLDTCYTAPFVPEDQLYRGVPTIIFHFAGSANLVIPPEHVLTHIQPPEHPDQRLCLAFAGDDTFDAIPIGNVQQQRHLFIFDMENNRIGFTPPNACS